MVDSSVSSHNGVFSLPCIASPGICGYHAESVDPSIEQGTLVKCLLTSCQMLSLAKRCPFLKSNTVHSAGVHFCQQLSGNT